MSTPAPSDPSSPRRPPWVSYAVGAAVVVAVVALFVILRGGGDASPGGAQTTGTSGPESVASSPGRLAALSKSLGRPIYWVGLSQSRTYELTQTTDGSVYVRYLERGVPVGDTRPNYLTVGTYPQSDPFKTVKQASARAGARVEKLAKGGLAVANRARPNSWYVAYPQAKELVEVFSPRAGRARELVRTGRVVPVTG